MNPFKVTIRNTNRDVERYIDINVIRIVIDIDEYRIQPKLIIFYYLALAFKFLMSGYPTSDHY